MESPTHMTFNAHRQLSSFVSLSDDDEMAQLILEELSFPRRSFTNVIAEMAAASPSNKQENGLNSISEDEDEEEEEM